MPRDNFGEYVLLDHEQREGGYQTEFRARALHGGMSVSIELWCLFPSLGWIRDKEAGVILTLDALSRLEYFRRSRLTEAPE